MLHDETLPASPPVPSGVNPAREPQPHAMAPLDAEPSEAAQRHLLSAIHSRIADELERMGTQRGATERALRERAMEAIERWRALRLDAAARDRRLRAAQTAMNRAIEPMRTLFQLGEGPAIAEVLDRWPGLSEALRGIPDDDARTAWWFSVDGRLKAEDKEARRWFEEHRAECDAAALCAMHDAVEPERPLLPKCDDGALVPKGDAGACELVRSVQAMLSRATTIDGAGVVAIHPEHLTRNRLDVLLRVPLDVGALVARIEDLADLPIYTRKMFKDAVREQYRLEGRGKGGAGGDKPTDTTIRDNLTRAGFDTEKSRAAFSERDLRRIVENWSLADRPSVELAVRKLIESRKGAGS